MARRTTNNNPKSAIDAEPTPLAGVTPVEVPNKASVDAAVSNSILDGLAQTPHLLGPFRSDPTLSNSVLPPTPPTTTIAGYAIQAVFSLGVDGNSINCGESVRLDSDPTVALHSNGDLVLSILTLPAFLPSSSPTPATFFTAADRHSAFPRMTLSRQDRQ